MDDFTTQADAAPVLTEIPRFVGPSESRREYAHALLPRKIPRANWILFLITLLTTTMAGANDNGAYASPFHPLITVLNLGAGFSFSIPLMLILFSHEMGHYLASRRHDVDTTWPYFIPGPYIMPFPIPAVGTFGAFIRMRALPRTRRAMFDIGAAGPWAGFIVALIAITVGLKLSQVTPLDNSQGGAQLGNSIIFWSVSRVILGVDPNSVNVNLHPIAFAGWLGLLVTTLNLLPVGQLDGGHVVYALLGTRLHRLVSRLAWLGTALMVVVPYLLGKDFWPGWLFWFVIVMVLGLGHPSTSDTETPLSGGRRLMAWATVALFIGTFSPIPFTFAPPTEPPSNTGRSYNVMQHHAPHPTFPAGFSIRL
jgi:membrane-associated protease RseP (regulator of RpoE activity)